MELETSERLVPLLSNEYSYANIDGLSLVDKLNCVSYRETKKIKRAFKKPKIQTSDRVKIIQDDHSVIPSEFIYNKNDKVYMSGDYLSIVLLDSFKQLKNENKFLKDTINRLQTRLARVEKIIRQ